MENDTSHHPRADYVTEELLEVSPNLGDVFRWSYPESADHYWCKSRIAVMTDRGLLDTYWTHCHDGDFKPPGVPSAVPKGATLKHLGNLAEFDYQGAKGTADDLYREYPPSDILDLNHANSPCGNVFLRKGAQKSKSVLAKRLALEIGDLEIERLTIDRQIDAKREQLLELKHPKPAQN